MTADDLDAVITNETRAYAFPWPRGVFADCIRVGNECHVGLLGDEIIGHAVLATGAGESHLLNVCISRDYQGFGYGRELVAYMLTRAVARDARVVFLEVRPSNRVAVQLYESMGFREIGVRKGYYFAPVGNEDARVLALDLEAHWPPEERPL
ncbi:MAG: ribosomal protein S18-alanine N-acetyltransferase [Pseudomonadales bacterium]|nr:ribosomal protein S18-alanine N-acetyltransferase [Pseudomonadales bacterium]MDP6471600.1 ribosomal protein S18-alanine N-acetyltransferase [Pseudomonadales bacterium]MDP6828863.1 ribosomal protein S18-alanine N-acetyltransferase [Pseudomonadales bacterium]